jgi:O-antigen ligase
MLPLERRVEVLAGLTVFAFACGSSSLPAASHAGKPLRWVALLALAGGAALLAWRRGVAVPRHPPLAALLALALCGLMALSTLWSVAPRLTVERTGTVVVLFAAAYLIGAVAAIDGRFARGMAVALFAGAVFVVLIGYLLFFVAHSHAVQAASDGNPARFRGFGENPNTVSMLCALVLPFGGSSFLAARTRAARAVFALALVLTAGAIVISESRGAALAAVGGAVVLFVLMPASIGSRRRLFALTAPLLIAGIILFVVRSQAGSSGRVDVWKHTIGMIELRPAVGYGFGTEDYVFVDRFQHFAGRRPEDSYLGFALQLGVVGLALFAGIVATVLAAAARSLVRRDALGGAAPAFGAVVIAGLLVAVNQSFVYSVGNIGAATFWIAVFALAAAADIRDGRAAAS